MGVQRLVRLVAAVAEKLPKETLHHVVNQLATLDERSSPAEKLAVCYTIAQGDARDLVEELIRCWQDQDSFPTKSLPFALQCASQVDDYHRNREEVHLIWTGPDVSGLPFRRTEQALLELITSAEKTLLIVAFAAYKVPELVKAINYSSESGVDVVCVFECSEERGGKLSFSPLSQLGLSPHVRTFIWPLSKRSKDSLGHYGSLHAKCAIADSTRLFVSSANLTEFAFHLNMELGVVIKGGSLPGAADKHFRELISNGYFERLYED